MRNVSECLYSLYARLTLLTLSTLEKLYVSDVDQQNIQIKKKKFKVFNLRFVCTVSELVASP